MDQQRPTVKSIMAKLGLASGEAETDRSDMQVKFQHPILHSKRGELLRQLNPSALLTESLMQNGLIAKDEGQKLKSEKFVLGKVKLILQSVSDCDDEGFSKFIDSLNESDANGSNSQLAGLLSKSYEEYKNETLGVESPPPCPSDPASK